MGAPAVARRTHGIDFKAGTMMTLDTNTIHVAVIGSGLAGSACAAGLQRAGVQVTLFEKAKTVGGHTATRCASWIDASGAEQSVTFDDIAQYFMPVKRRLKPVVARAMAAGCVSAWRPRVHAGWPLETGQCLIAAPAMPTLCSHLIAGATVHLNRTVRRLQRTADGSWYVASDGIPLSGPFHHVVVALPPAQAAVLLAGHQDEWADALLAKRIEPSWTLTAVTDDVDWPWDAAQPDRGPLAWVLRNDRVPGRTTPPGLAVWTAHATAEWSLAHLEDDPQALIDELKSALRRQLPTPRAGNGPVQWHYANAHRGRYPGSSVDCNDSIGSNEVWWDEFLALGVCGHLLEGGGVEADWYSGDELAECMATSFERSAVPDRDSAARSTPARTTPNIHLPRTKPPVVNHQATRVLLPPIEGEASPFADAGLKVSHRISFSTR
jgi:renalase